MLSQTSRRILVVAVLLSALLLPAVPVQALPLGFDTTPGLAPVAGLLERLWAYLEGLSGFNKEGVSIDPDGHHITPPPGDAGVSIDPDGDQAAGGIGSVTSPNR
jgi:hypothetical protein